MDQDSSILLSVDFGTKRQNKRRILVDTVVPTVNLGRNRQATQFLLDLYFPQVTA